MCKNVLCSSPRKPPRSSIANDSTDPKAEMIHLHCNSADHDYSITQQTFEEQLTASQKKFQELEEKCAMLEGKGVSLSDFLMILIRPGALGQKSTY